MEDTSGVIAGAAPVADALPASGASDTAGHSAAGETFTGAPTEQTITTDETAGGDAPAEETALPISEEELNAAPDQWREKLSSILQWGKSLEKDLKTNKAMAETFVPLVEQYGDVEAIQQNLAALSGFGVYATDEAGQVLRDANGFPVLTTAPFLEAIASRDNGTQLVGQLAYDLLNMPAPDGRTWGAHVLEYYGVDPNNPQAVRAESQVTNAGISAEEKEAIASHFPNPKFGQAYEGLTVKERELVQDYLYEGNTADAERILQREAERQDSVAYLQQQAKAETESFWSTVRTSAQQAVQTSERQILANLLKPLSSQVTFSQDPTTNAVQQSAIGALVAALCNQDTRFTMEPVMQALGLQHDPNWDGMMQAYQNAVETYHVLKAASENPRFSHYRNDTEMRRLAGNIKDMEVRFSAKLAPIAGKLAKIIAGENQSLREAGTAAVAAAQGRPTVGGNGAAQNGRQVPRGVDPFSVDFLRQISQ